MFSSKLNLKIMHMFSNIRIYSTLFSLQTQKHGADLTITPPTLIQNNSIIKTKYSSSAIFNIVQLANKYTKGRTTEFYILSMKDLMTLSCWNGGEGGTVPLIMLNRNKSVCFSRGKEGREEVSIVFQDKDLEKSNQMKQFLCQRKKFQLFQSLLLHTYNELTFNSQYALSVTSSFYKELYPERTNLKSQRPT